LSEYSKQDFDNKLEFENCESEQDFDIEDNYFEVNSKKGEIEENNCQEDNEEEEFDDDDDDD